MLKAIQQLARRTVFIPVWLLTFCLRPSLPEDHPWQGERTTLNSWAERGTPLALHFSLVFWLYGLTLAVFLIRFGHP